MGLQGPVPLRQPWESPGILGAAIGRTPLFAALRPLAMPQPSFRWVMQGQGELERAVGTDTAEQVALGSERYRLAPMRTAVAKRARLVAAPDKGEQKVGLLKRWKAVLLLKPEASVVGIQVANSKDEQEEDAIVEAALADRKPNTLAQRLSGLSAYLSAVKANLRGWPPDEQSSWEHFRAWAREDAPLTRAKSFFEALLFLRHTLLFESLEPVLQSRRLSGTVCLRVSSMPERHQAREFLPHEVQEFQAAMRRGGLDDVELMTASSVLFEVAFRGRFMDMGNLVSLRNEGSFVVGKLADTKTQSHGKERLPLLIMGPAKLMEEEPWLFMFELVRENLGLRLEDGWPVFPAMRDGKWVKEPIGLQSFNFNLALLLQKLNFDHTTSHSGKVTLWSSRLGAPTDTQVALGYHKVKSESASVRSYSRDLLAEPVGWLIKMLRKLRRGECDPYASPGERWKNAEETATQKWAHISEVDENVGEACSPTARWGEEKEETKQEEPEDLSASEDESGEKVAAAIADWDGEVYNIAKGKVCFQLRYGVWKENHPFRAENSRAPISLRQVHGQGKVVQKNGRGRRSASSQGLRAMPTPANDIGR